MAEEMMIDPRVERDLAEILGASPLEAADIVAALADAGVLEHGVVVVAAVLAARTGVEIMAALDALAGGQPPPTGMSDYELRTAAEEGEADMRELWEAGPPAGDRAATAWRRLNDRAPELTLGSDAAGAGAAIRASMLRVGPPRGDST